MEPNPIQKTQDQAPSAQPTESGMNNHNCATPAWANESFKAKLRSTLDNPDTSEISSTHFLVL